MAEDEDEFATVSVWLGAFASEARLEVFFEETYGDDDTPISEFARCQGEWFYDHDFVERGFRAPTQVVRELLLGHSFSRSFVEPLEAATGPALRAPANTVVLVWGREIKSPRSVRGTDFDLEFVGTFSCDPTADAL